MAGESGQFNDHGGELSFEFIDGESKISVPVYLCEECCEELEDDVFDEQNIAAQVICLDDKGFEIQIQGVCSEDLLRELGGLIRWQISWCHGGHEGGFGDDLVHGPEDTEYWDGVWERVKGVYGEIFDEMAKWRKEDPDK